MADHRYLQSDLNKLVLASGMEIVRIKLLPKMNDELCAQILNLITQCNGVTIVTEELNNLAYEVTGNCYTANREMVENNALAVPLGDTTFYFNASNNLSMIVELLRAGIAAGESLWGNAAAATMSENDVKAEAMGLLNLGIDVVKGIFSNKPELSSKDLRLIRSVLTVQDDDELREIYEKHSNTPVTGRVNANHLDYMMMMSYLYYRCGDDLERILLAAMYVMSKSQQKVLEQLPDNFKEAYDECLKILQHCKLPECDARKVPAYAMTAAKCKRIIVLTAAHMGQKFTVSCVDDLSFTTSPRGAMTLLHSLYTQFRLRLTPADVFKLGQVARNGLNGVQLNFNYCTGGLMKTIAGQPKEKYYVLMQKDGVISCANPRGPFAKESRNLEFKDN